MKHINWKKLVADVTSAAISVGATTVLSSCATQAPTATLTRSVQVAANPDAVWTAIGPYCAIKDWLPPIGTCTQDGASPPTRTLVTKDGSATFVETQTARNDARHTYSYAFVSSPLPVTHYTSTIEVKPNGDGASTVTWRSTYVPDAGKEAAASDALTGVYDAGLASIQAQFAK